MTGHVYYTTTVDSGGRFACVAHHSRIGLVLASRRRHLSSIQSVIWSDERFQPSNTSQIRAPPVQASGYLHFLHPNPIVLELLNDTSPALDHYRQI
jgi:hypothetical protein